MVEDNVGLSVGGRGHARDVHLSSDILRPTRSFSNAMRSFRSHVSTARIVELFTATGTFTIVIVLVEDSIGAWTTCGGNSVRCGSSDGLRPTRSSRNASRSFSSHVSTARIVELFTATGTFTIVIILVEDSVGARTTCGNSGSDMLRPTRCFSNAKISFRSLLSTARIVKLFTATGILTILFSILVEDSVGAWTTFTISGRCDFSSSDGGDRVYFDGVCNGNKG